MLFWPEQKMNEYEGKKQQQQPKIKSLRCDGEVISLTRYGTHIAHTYKDMYNLSTANSTMVLILIEVHNTLNTMARRVRILQSKRQIPG